MESILSRRTVLKGSAAGLAGMAVVRAAGPASAFPAEAEADTVVPWVDQPDPIPPGAADVLGHPLVWESLDGRYTPNDAFFTVKHYQQPELSPTAYRLEVDGLVARPQTLTLAALQALPRSTVEFTLECSGNHGLPFLIGGIGNARWSGTSLRRLLTQARPGPRASEVVFWGADSGPVAIRDNPGVVSAGATGQGEPDAGGGLDLLITERFARSMTLEQAMAPGNLLCDQMNGVTLPPEHGYPVRLIAPGWYGVANVKWLTRIELIDTRFQGRFMSRDYVTFRERRVGGRTEWTFTTVTHDRLKSAPAKVTRRGKRYDVMGAAWGAPITKVQVQVDDGPWQPTTLHLRPPVADGASWRFWSFDWGTPSSGLHTVRSRAFGEDGVQPAPDDPSVAGRRTFWENNGHVTRTVRIP